MIPKSLDPFVRREVEEGPYGTEAPTNPGRYFERPSPVEEVPTRRTSPGCTTSIAWSKSGTTRSRSAIRFDAAPMTTMPKESVETLCWCSMLPSIVTKTSHSPLARFRSAPFFVPAHPSPWTVETV